MHNELGYLLLDGLKRIGGSDHESSSIYRQWLRTFLMRSKNYDAKAQLSWLPETFLHERALVLARMQNHKAVLKIYAISLRDDKLAEDYCENIWGEATQSRDTRLVTEPHNPEILSNTASDVYTTLANIYASQLVIQHSTTDATLPWPEIRCCCRTLIMDCPWRVHGLFTDCPSMDCLWLLQKIKSAKN